ncbi:hypothetical protein SAMN05444159_5754 [Bradyrhizobium lablabi]|uniref:Uncharacterized protein n=1 Tax=Bradyrhizobium lablabi TaxID=722472 RepID=A0A1M7A6F8_9BRAD|nr:hypothetical protein [Bradyrhizobium lablabi]SHL38275.1 hypothetical protein SAMN05444159_5754 [Bradyrhizobium lablabi]
MLLPHMWLRKFWLRRAMRDYPLYDPPHKVEEYLLSREQATENFDYFMRVRLERFAYFQNWLRRYFWVAITSDERGVKALSRWGNRYAGLLLVIGPDGDPTDSYFTYDPPWTGENAGNNVVFDMGIALGEIIIANCPKLHWALEPTSAILPRRSKMLKRSSGMSFQRPKLTGWDDPTWTSSSLHEAEAVARQMMRYMTTFKGRSRFNRCHKADRLLIRDQLLNGFKGTLRDYPAGDPYKLRGQMSADDYARLVDSETDEEDNGDE